MFTYGDSPDPSDQQSVPSEEPRNTAQMNGETTLPIESECTNENLQVQHNYARDGPGSTSHQNFFPINGTFCQVVNHNGFGHIEVSALIKELTTPPNLLHKNHLEILLGVVRLFPTFEGINSNNHSPRLLVPIKDVLHSMEFFYQHQVTMSGTKLIENHSGRARLTWHGGNLISPYVVCKDQTYIPLSYANKMDIPGFDLVMPVQITGFKKAHLAAEIVNLDDSQTPYLKFARAIMAVSITKIKQSTGTDIQIDFIK